MSTAESTGQAPGRGRLEDRHVLVVGAGTRPSAETDAPIGNGRAISVLAAREGATVACADIDAGAASATVELVEGEGGKAVAITADVSQAEQCAEMVGQANASLGGLDGLVLNVGIALGPGLEGTSAEDWDRALAVNVRSHFLACQAALPLMPEGSAVVFISSVAGLRAGSGSPSYDSSKAALLGLARHVAREAAPHQVRANVVVPGLIDTPIGRAASEQNPARDRIASLVPLGRQGTAWEIAHATVFLLSGEASYITGQTLIVDGGLMA